MRDDGCLDKSEAQWYISGCQAEVAKQADAPRSGRGGYYIHEGSSPSLGTKRAPVEIIQLGFLFVRRPEANQVTEGVR